ncbi:MAG: TetR/AcrR family transcriptional regulator [Bacteroidetes bacterium]|nr:TetR/AcrR family transcriptional regulator [Bacteroidota bacterium]
MLEPKYKILKAAEQVFMRIGVKSVTMDDISKELGISKKTLYQFVSDKNDLIKQCFTVSLDQNCMMIAELHKIENPIDEVLEIMKHMSLTMKKMNPMALHEIRRFYPESWTLFETYKHEYILKSVISNFEKGIKKGYYRKKIDIQILAKIYVEVISLLMGDQLFTSHDYSFQQIYLQFMDYHLRGICTAKGIEHLETRLKELSFN